MTRLPAPRPDATDRIAAVLAGLLALLAALMGVAGRRGVRMGAIGVGPHEDEYAGVMACVRRAEAEAEFGYEPWVEWVAVPAPWRNGRLLPRRHAARRLRPCGVRPVARMRGPPVRVHSSRPERTGIA